MFASAVGIGHGRDVKVDPAVCSPDGETALRESGGRASMDGLSGDANVNVDQVESAAVSNILPHPVELDEWYALLSEIRARVTTCVERLALDDLDDISRRLWLGQLEFYRSILMILRAHVPSITPTP